MPKIIGAVICGSLALIALVVSICSFKNIGFPLNTFGRDSKHICLENVCCSIVSIFIIATL